MTAPSVLFRAGLWMLGAIVSFSTMAVAGRKLSIELDTFELMMYRSFISLGLVLAIGGMAGTLNQISRRDLRLHGVRNFAHFAGQNLWFAAIALIPLAQVIALEFTSPIWVALMAPIFLSERLTKLRLFVAFAGFIGILIVARPDPSGLEFGALLAASSAIFFAATGIATKILTREHSVTSILFWLALMQSVFGIIAAGWDFDVAWPSPDAIPWVILVSVTGLTAHFCLTIALGLGPAVVVMPMDFFRLPLVAFLGMFFFAETLDPFVFIGAIVIVGANYLNILNETRGPKHH